MNKNKYSDISIREDIAGCLLCNHAPCTSICPYQLEVDRIIRAVRFDNKQGAAERLPANVACYECVDKPCLQACLKAQIGQPVPIDRIIMAVSEIEDESVKTIPPSALSTESVNVGASADFITKAAGTYPDLSIDFCGISCENPFFLSSSVVGNNYEMVAKAFKMGWAGVAFKTIGAYIPEDVSPRFDFVRNESNSPVGLKNIEQISDHPLEENLEFIRRLKKEFPTKIIIASILGQNEQEWTMLAEKVTKAGADIIECNFSCPHMAADGLGSDVGQNPEMVALYTKAVRKGTTIPVLAKMTPNTGNMEPAAIAAIEAGADGLAAINTIKSITGIDLDNFTSGPAIRGKTTVGGYSGRAIKPIALRFIHDLKTCSPISSVPLSGMGGIETWSDAAEFLALGCENIQVTTSVMQYGYRVIEDMIEGMSYYLAQHGYTSIRQIIGNALPNIIAADDLDRKSICYPKFNREKCVGCGRCYISCYDGGHQAIKQNKETGKPILEAKKCVGCHLCLLICPVGAIDRGLRVIAGGVQDEKRINYM